MLDSYTTVNLLGIVGGFCALVMVTWALYLIQTGIITLQNAIPRSDDPQTALTVEVQKALKVRVQSSVISLFVVAMAFFCAGLYFVQGNRSRALLVNGDIQSEDNALVTVSLSTQWQSVQTTGGEIRGEIWPSEKIEVVKVEITTPGHEPGQIVTMAYPDKHDSAHLYFKPVTIGKKVVDKPPPGPLATPAVQLAPLPQ